MKKTLPLLLALMLCLTLCACGSGNGANEITESKTPYEDEFKKKVDENFISGIDRQWLIYQWMKSGLENFKNPASVEVTGNCYYCQNEETKEMKFALVEVRADNSFGGKSVGYVKVSPSGIVQTDWIKTVPPQDFEGEKVWNGGILGEWFTDALNEYIELNYK